MRAGNQVDRSNAGWENESMARLVISLSAADQGPSVELSPREKPLSVGERRRFSEEVLGMAMSFSAYQLLASFFGDHDQNMAPRHSDDWWKENKLNKKGRGLLDFKKKADEE